MIDKTIIDLDDALQRALGDVAFLKMMFDEFHQSLPEFIAAIEASVSKADMPTLDRTAHQLKGASANLGAVGISSAALALERIGRSNKPDSAKQSFEAFLGAVEDFNRELARVDWAALGE